MDENSLSLGNLIVEIHGNGKYTIHHTWTEDFAARMAENYPHIHLFFIKLVPF